MAPWDILNDWLQLCAPTLIMKIKSVKKPQELIRWLVVFIQKCKKTLKVSPMQDFDHIINLVLVPAVWTSFFAQFGPKFEVYSYFFAFPVLFSNFWPNHNKIPCKRSHKNCSTTIRSKYIIYAYNKKNQRQGQTNAKNYGYIGLVQLVKNYSNFCWFEHSCPLK